LVGGGGGLVGGVWGGAPPPPPPPPKTQTPNPQSPIPILYVCISF